MKKMGFVLLAAAGLWGTVQAAEENLAGAAFGRLENGLPSGFTIPEIATAQLKISGETVKIDGNELHATVLRIEKPTFIRLLGSPLQKITADRKYLCSFLIKIDDMKSTSAEGIRFYIYNTGGGRHYWMQVRSDGSTAGWVTVTLPFEGKFLEPDKGPISFFIYFNEVTGVFRLADLVIMELPADVAMDPAFTSLDGKALSTQVLSLESLTK